MISSELSLTPLCTSHPAPRMSWGTRLDSSHFHTFHLISLVYWAGSLSLEEETRSVGHDFFLMIHTALGLMTVASLNTHSSVAGVGWSVVGRPHHANSASCPGLGPPPPPPLSKVVGLRYLLFSSCETLWCQMQPVERTLKENKQPNAKVGKGLE